MNCQAKLANKHAMLDPVQRLRQSVRLHTSRAHEFQQDLAFLYLLVDPLIADINIPRTCGLQRVEYSQPGVLTVCIDE